MPERPEPLSLEQRIELYRRRAGRMMQLSEGSESEGVKLAYLKLAAHWQDLILDLERIKPALPKIVEAADEQFPGAEAN